MLHKIRDALESKKGADLEILDVRKVSSITDYYVMATGNSAPHIKALADEVEAALKKTKVRCYRRSGTPDSGWVALDYLDAVIHVFSREARDYYGLSALWSDAPRVD